MRLFEKAEEFDKVIQHPKHMHIGLVMSCENPNATEAYIYHNVQMSGMWTGVYIASQALRFKVTQTQEAYHTQTLEAYHNMSRSLSAIHALRMITGKEGLMAKAFLRGANLASLGGGPEHRHEGQGRFKDYVWLGDASRDIYMGVFFGLGTAYKCIQNLNGPIKDIPDEDIKSLTNQIVEDIKFLTNHIVDNGLKIVGVSNKVTTYGDFTPLVESGTFPFGELMALSIIRTAYWMTGEQKFKDAIEAPHPKVLKLKSSEGLIDLANLAERLYNAVRVIFMESSYILFMNYNLAFMALFSLMTSEDNPVKRRDYQDILKTIWANRKHELNSFFNFIHQGLAGQPSDKDSKKAIREAKDSLERFPCPLVTKEVDRSTLSKTLRMIGLKKVLKMDRRATSDFMWKENPYGGKPQKDLGWEFHPTV